jgi:hypothetical protein
MKRKLTFATLLPLAAMLAGCGGGGGSATDSNSAPATALKLSGWYQCLPNGAPSASARIQNANPAVLTTPHGTFYGQCSDGFESVNVSSNYAGSVSKLADFDNLVVTATLSNFQFYDPTTNLVATNMVGTVLPVDTYTTVAPTASLNASGTISFNETGNTSREGAPARFIVPTTLNLVGPVTPAALSVTPTTSGTAPPATAGGYAGSYSGVPLPFAQSGVINTTALTVDTNGDFTATTAAGSLVGTLSAYDLTTGTAEYTGTLTTSSSAVPVQGAYNSNYYTVTEANLANGGTASVTYAPLALFIKGIGFQYELLAVPN